MEFSSANYKGGVPSILLWGGTGQSKIIQAMIAEEGLGNVKIIYDSNLKKSPFETRAAFVNQIDELRLLIPGVSHFVVCIGGEHGYARARVAMHLEGLGLQSITIAHKESYIDPTVILGGGCQIMPAAVIHKYASIGSHVIINTNATIDHDCLVGNGVHIMGSAAIAGEVEIGDYATIGTNATVLPFLKIGKGAIVGAGAVVTKNVEPMSVVYGVPAKVYRKNIFQEPNLLP